MMTRAAFLTVFVRTPLHNEKAIASRVSACSQARTAQRSCGTNGKGIGSHQPRRAHAAICGVLL
eukprot:scaffold302171_cov37-Tisochrysis_lutea.AAC.1